MQFIKIGDRYLNLDNVTQITPIVGGMPLAIRVFFGPGDCCELEGADAAMLRAWLLSNARDISET